MALLVPSCFVTLNKVLLKYTVQLVVIWNAILLSERHGYDLTSIITAMGQLRNNEY